MSSPRMCGNFKSKRFRFVLDTPEKYKDFYEAIVWNKSPHERLKFIGEIYPDFLTCTHAHIAENIGLERETVSRYIHSVRQELGIYV